MEPGDLRLLCARGQTPPAGSRGHKAVQSRKESQTTAPLYPLQRRIAAGGKGGGPRPAGTFNKAIFPRIQPVSRLRPGLLERFALLEYGKLYRRSIKFRKKP